MVDEAIRKLGLGITMKLKLSGMSAEFVRRHVGTVALRDGELNEYESSGLDVLEKMTSLDLCLARARGPKGESFAWSIAGLAEQFAGSHGKTRVRMRIVSLLQNRKRRTSDPNLRVCLCIALGMLRDRRALKTIESEFLYCKSLQRLYLMTSLWAMKSRLAHKALLRISNLGADSASRVHAAILAVLARCKGGVGLLIAEAGNPKHNRLLRCSSGIALSLFGDGRGCGIIHRCFDGASERDRSRLVDLLERFQTSLASTASKNPEIREDIASVLSYIK